jgi:hypothetical protein
MTSDVLCPSHEHLRNRKFVATHIEPGVCLDVLARHAQVREADARDDRGPEARDRVGSQHLGRQLRLVAERELGQDIGRGLESSPAHLAGENHRSGLGSVEGIQDRHACGYSAADSSAAE